MCIKHGQLNKKTILKSSCMKKSILMVAAAFLFSVVSVSAQNQGQQGPQGQRMSSAERNKARVDTITKQLSLNAEQKAKVTALFTKNSADSQKARESMRDMSQEDRMKAMTATQDKTNAEMKKILTPEQYKKYLVNQAKELKDRAARRAAGGQGGFGGQGGQRPQRTN